MSKKSLKEKVSEIAGLPKDVSMGMSIVRIIGHQELYIENYRGILEYTTELIRLQTKIGQIHIVGKKLDIIYYTNDEMKVTGYIHKLEFHQGG